MFSLIRRDVERYLELESHESRRGVFEVLRLFGREPGLHAVVLYRFGSWTYRHVGFKPLRILLKLAYVVLEKIGVMLWGIHIHPMADIGPGLYIGHWGGVLIGPVKMGADCNIAHQVTIGLRADGTSGLPVLGDRVWVGVGSVIFGAIHIGDGVTIGPLTVVSRNLPPRVLVIGNPMRVLRRDYDNRAQIYGTPRAGSPPESLPSARR